MCHLYESSKVWLKQPPWFKPYLFPKSQSGKNCVWLFRPGRSSQWLQPRTNESTAVAFSHLVRATILQLWDVMLHMPLHAFHTNKNCKQPCRDYFGVYMVKVVMRFTSEHLHPYSSHYRVLARSDSCIVLLMQTRPIQLLQATLATTSNIKYNYPTTSGLLPATYDLELYLCSTYIYNLYT